MRFPRSGKTKLRSAPLGNARVDNDWTKNGNPKKRVNSLLTLFLFLTSLTYSLFIDFDSFSIESVNLSTGQKKVCRDRNILSFRNPVTVKSIN